jgi:hypothetical protein
MAIKRLSRVGQALRIPLVCDPLVQAQLADRVREAGEAAHAKVLALHLPGPPYPDEVLRVAAAQREAARQAQREANALAVDRFSECLDPAVLGVDLAGVTHVTIRVLDGFERHAALCDAVVAFPNADPTDRRAQMEAGWAHSVEIARRGLLAVSDDPATQVMESDGTRRYPLAPLKDMPDVEAVIREIVSAIDTAGSLGKAPPSLCDGPSGETTHAARAAVESSPSATAAPETPQASPSTSESPAG